MCVGCVDENEVFPGDGGGDGGRPVTGVPGCPARYTPGCWSEDAVVSPCGLERRLLLTSGDGSHLDCTQMEGSISDVGGSDASDLLESVPRMNVERTSSPPLPATSSPSLHPF